MIREAIGKIIGGEDLAERPTLDQGERVLHHLAGCQQVQELGRRHAGADLVFTGLELSDLAPEYGQDKERIWVIEHLGVDQFLRHLPQPGAPLDFENQPITRDSQRGLDEGLELDPKAAGHRGGDQDQGGERAEYGLEQSHRSTGGTSPRSRILGRLRPDRCLDCRPHCRDESLREAPNIETASIQHPYRPDPNQGVGQEQSIGGMDIGHAQIRLGNLDVQLSR